MDPAEAIRIIEALANGVDPTTGEVLPDASPYNDPSIIRALFVSLKVLAGANDRERRTRMLPGKAEKPWSPKEDQLLIDSFDRAVPLRQIARERGRTEGG